MMKTIGLALTTAIFVFSCASSDDQPQQPQYPRRGGGRGGYGGEMRPAADAGLLGVLPPPNWWHDPHVSTAVKLSDSQYTALDAMAKDHQSDMDRLRMDTTAAERDLRLLLTAEKPTASDILTAGGRVKSDRDQLLDHEVRMLADERALLTKEQWTALQDALRTDREDSRGNRGGFGGPGGRRGGWGGRRPGY